MKITRYDKLKQIATRGDRVIIALRNQFGYDRQQLLINNKDKTIKLGAFAFVCDATTTNRNHFDFLISDLEQGGYAVYGK